MIDEDMTDNRDCTSDLQVHLLVRTTWAPQVIHNSNSIRAGRLSMFTLVFKEVLSYAVANPSNQTVLSLTHTCALTFTFTLSILFVFLS